MTFLRMTSNGNRTRDLLILNPQVDSLLFAAVLLLLLPIQIEEVEPVFQIGGLTLKLPGPAAGVDGSLTVTIA